MFIDPKAARKAQFAEILETMCEALELTPMQTEEAEKRYDAVGRWLGEDAILVGAWIYVHGSVALGTTTQNPLQRPSSTSTWSAMFPTARPTSLPRS
jgi:hypothetical protein